MYIYTLPLAPRLLQIWHFGTSHHPPPPKKKTLYGTSCIANQNCFNFTTKKYTLCKRKKNHIKQYLNSLVSITDPCHTIALNDAWADYIKLTDTSELGREPHGLATHGFQSFKYGPS